MEPEKENEWEAMPLPEQHESIVLNRTLSSEETQYLLLGYRPISMDDKWFIYTKHEWIYFHRSWTGFCIFKIKLVLEAGKYILTEALVNRNPNQFNSAGSESDVELINRVIDIIVRVKQRDAR